MDAAEWEAEPVVDPCADVLGIAVTLVAGLALIVPVLPLPCAPPEPPLSPPVEAPRAINGAGAECGAIMAWGMELSRVTRASEAGADWTKDLGFAGPLARGVACVVCVVGALKLGDGAEAAFRLTPSWARGNRAPALIAPLAPCVARIAVDGTAAS